MSADQEPADIYQQRQLPQIAARWDARAAHWDESLCDPACHLNEDDAYRRVLDVIDEAIRGRAAYCQSRCVIDIGCGTGLVLARVVGHFASGIGVDISPDMIRCAVAKAIPNTRFIVADGFNLAGLPRAGAVVSRGVLLSHYGRDTSADLLQSWHALLEPGGVLVCDFLSETGRAASIHKPSNKTYFTAAEVLDKARAAGFDSARIVGDDLRRVLILVAVVE